MTQVTLGHRLQNDTGNLGTQGTKRHRQLRDTWNKMTQVALGHREQNDTDCLGILGTK